MQHSSTARDSTGESVIAIIPMRLISSDDVM